MTLGLKGKEEYKCKGKKITHNLTFIRQVHLIPITANV